MPKKKYTVWSDDERRMAMTVAISDSMDAAVRQTGVPRRTLERWIASDKYADAVAEIRAAHEETALDVRDYLIRRQQAVYAVLDKIIAALADDTRIAEAKYSQLTTAFGTLVDKYLIVKGIDPHESGGVVILPAADQGGDDA